ncbi:ROK family transcriptional regulator [Pseudonocardia sp. CA-107938]|uniref:ROK family transcriptional regulator n=1 Tax=Pseudonocardia sp. CA-107938 TaxID=3240021 RepID=UPI003D929B6C
MPPPARIDPAIMRKLNRGACLRIVRDRGSVTMAELARASGLSRRTVELIVEELLASGHVHETDPSAEPRTVGRPARSYAFNPRIAHAMAIEIGEDAIAVAICDLVGNVVASERTPVGSDARRADRVAAVHAAVTALVARAGLGRSDVRAVTVASMGVVHDDGVVDLRRKDGDLALVGGDWSGFHLAGELGDLFDCDVTVENDAKLAAVGEAWQGAARGVDNFVFVLSNGVRSGVGIVIDGELYRGHDGQAGEVFWAESFFHVGRTIRPNALLHLGSPDPSARRAAEDALAGARAGEPEARRAVADLAHDLTPALHAIMCLLAPEVLVVGGSTGRAGDVLVPAIERELATLVRPGTRLHASTLGDDAVIRGALRHSLTRIEAELF